MDNGAPYVGVATDGMSSGTMQPLKIARKKLKESAEANAEAPSPLSEMSDAQRNQLLQYLEGRLTGGVLARDRRIKRYGAIDRSISTWQKLNQEDSERERLEDMSGKAQPIPFNLPVMASHLNDMVSYFTESLAPISNPFYSASGQAEAKDLLEKMKRDALRRNYYGELTLVIRALLKYNLSGFHVDWDEGAGETSILSQPGNRISALCPYNTLWDPSIRNPHKLPAKGEWAASASMVNRLTLMRHALKGDWFGLEDVCSTDYPQATTAKYYKEPPIEAGITADGQDSHTSGSNTVDWNSYALGYATDLGPEVDGFEKVCMYCWLVPAQFGLLTDIERDALLEAGKDPDSYLELWEFTLVCDRIVEAEPVLPREDALGGEVIEIPYYLSYLTQDQMREAQRSFMELMKGFQRFASTMYNIYTNGMRSKVWGITGYDPAMFDMAKLPKGEVVGMIAAKQSNRDVRTGMTNMSTASGVDDALQSVDQTLALKDRFFPSQALPNQVAGIDRAINSQVAIVSQGTQRSMRMVLRSIDSNLFLPVRLAAFRNLKRLDSAGIEMLDDEAVSKLVGSGIESMEAERVSEALWKLMYAIVQNQESMQRFDIPALLTYISRTANLSVDLGQFARETPEEAAARQQQAQASQQAQVPQPQ